MSDITRPDLVDASGDRLTLAEYEADFGRYEQQVRNHDSWKLERIQTFDESGDPGFEAFRRGDWAEALRIAESQEPALREQAAADLRDRSSVFRRVRVVEEPLSPYLQWELHVLHVRSRSGSPIRVVSADQVARWETDRPLPELVVLGGRVLYRVLYTDDGVPEGAMRFPDARLAREWEAFISTLFETGEHLESYMERHVMHLPAPTT
jgi:hypothetical protein